ncbi:MAG: hypothetical protein MK171_04050 [Pirellulales bacterium]|nr:hypothetical protein [Pirellulales bacterium]
MSARYSGGETLFPGNAELAFYDIDAGTSSTILFVRAALPSNKPDDI